MTITPGRYRTRSGTEVVVVAIGLRIMLYPVLGYYVLEDCDRVSHWVEDGRFDATGNPHDCDLVERIESVKVKS
jgi:hypothetical protein